MGVMLVILIQTVEALNYNVSVGDKGAQFLALFHPLSCFIVIFNLFFVVFQQTHQLVLGNTSHYPVNNSLMIGDYVTPASTVLGAQTYRQ